MSFFCGWFPNDPREQAEGVVEAMGRALRVHSGQSWACWPFPCLSVGILELPTQEPVEQAYAPAISSDKHYYLWMFGEVFKGGKLIDIHGVEHTRTLSFRQALLNNLLKHGVESIKELDGEYNIVLWDRAKKVLTLLNDRFGGLPFYWASSSYGFAFASGVRGVLMAPGISADPDPEAIREAVTFGGYRLSNRTNIRAVKMVPGASIVTVHNGRPTLRRYWHWSDIESVPERPIPDLIKQIHHLWRQAVEHRLAGAKRPGQLLSGGLDSRLILAEAAPHVPKWTAITFGIAGCDDARYAQQAADAMGVTWVFHPLYTGKDPDWLDYRTSYIQKTDGLIDLHDLKYVETIPLQSTLLDVHLSGYIGDAVIGPTFNDVATAKQVLAKMPFYRTKIGMNQTEALERINEIFSSLDDAPARFALFEHKLPQSTNRWIAAFRPWIRVRKPFLDCDFFDFCQGLQPEIRGKQAIYQRWLKFRYPECFARIPWQKTGVPILTSYWLWQVDRVRRFAWRKVQPYLSKIGISTHPRLRYYTADEFHWRTPEARIRIEGVILRPGSLCCDILGHEAVKNVVSAWFERVDSPAQVIGAMYVYEVYHRDLHTYLRTTR